MVSTLFCPFSSRQHGKKGAGTKSKVGRSGKATGTQYTGDKNRIFQTNHTSVSIANGGFQLSGGMILQIPYFLPSGAILRIYSMGSLNSSSVGRKVGASGRPWGRTRLTGSFGALGWPRRSTVDRSRGAERRALKGTLWE